MEILTKKLFLVCGVISPLVYIGMAILGGALIPGYSHRTDTVSELMSPGAPNKPLMDILMATSSVLMALFGLGMLIFIRDIGHIDRYGSASAILLVILGILQIVVVIFFPQDPMGAELTFPGKMHIALVGVQAIMSVLIPLFLGIWLRKTEVMPGFGTYSIISAVLTVAVGATIPFLGSSIMGLMERLTILVYDLWLVVISIKLFSYIQ